MDSETSQTIREVLSGAEITVQEVIDLLGEGNSSAAELSDKVRNALGIIKDMLRDKQLGVDALQSLGPRGQSGQNLNVSMTFNNHVATNQAHNQHHSHSRELTNTIAVSNQPSQGTGSTPVRTDQPFARSANASDMQQRGTSALWRAPLQPQAGSSSSNPYSVLPPQQGIEDDDIPPSSGIRRVAPTPGNVSSSSRSMVVGSGNVQATPPVSRSASAAQGSTSSSITSMRNHQSSGATVNPSSRNATPPSTSTQATPLSSSQSRVQASNSAPPRSSSSSSGYGRSSKQKTTWCAHCNTFHSHGFICRPCPVEGCTGRLLGGKNPTCAVCTSMKGCCRVCPDRHLIDKKRAPCFTCPKCKRGIVVQGIVCNECGLTPPHSDSKRRRVRRSETYEDEAEGDLAQDGYGEDTPEPDALESGHFESEVEGVDGAEADRGLRPRNTDQTQSISEVITIDDDDDDAKPPPGCPPPGRAPPECPLCSLELRLDAVVCCAGCRHAICNTCYLALIPKDDKKANGPREKKKECPFCRQCMNDPIRLRL